MSKRNGHLLSLGDDFVDLSEIAPSSGLTILFGEGSSFKDRIGIYVNVISPAAPKDRKPAQVLLPRAKVFSKSQNGGILIEAELLGVIRNVVSINSKNVKKCSIVKDRMYVGGQFVIRVKIHGNNYCFFQREKIKKIIIESAIDEPKS